MTPQENWLKAARSWSTGMGMSDEDVLSTLQSRVFGFGLPLQAAAVVVAEMRRQLDAESLAEAPEREARRARYLAEKDAVENAPSFSRDAGEAGNEDGAWGSSSYDGWRVD